MERRGLHLIEAAGGSRESAGLLARLFAGGRERMLRKLDAGLATGSIRATLPDGQKRVLGGKRSGFEAEIHVHDWRCILRLATGGSVGWYRAWEKGEWSSPDPVQIFALFMANADSLGQLGRAKGPWRMAARAYHWARRNTRTGSQQNISAHYDLGNDFYAPWLGETMAYSSAIWREAMTLDKAQAAKMHAMAARIDGAPGNHVLEIGCGWGSLSAMLAENGYEVEAISLSDEQLAHARALAPDVDFRKQDYRDVDGRYDAIVSVEMVEALGQEYWPTFMDCIAHNLKKGGRAAIQFISIRDELFDAYSRSADFIQTYIFPGGMLIRTSEFRALAEARGLTWSDETRFGLDYARTLADWRQRFDRAYAQGKMPADFDDRFADLWRYYLMYCEGGFRGGGIDVHQVTLIKP
ncbi:class I SAM-dependent methyltransferase [Croceicoccus mobilis]|uniref:class I SAM-dependent methyltransferase n=1 Tax=Croceicoccus mobilis TaxID=1703339 RepID=UPI00082D9335